MDQKLRFVFQSIGAEKLARDAKTIANIMKGMGNKGGIRSTNIPLLGGMVSGGKAMTIQNKYASKAIVEMDELFAGINNGINATRKFRMEYLSTMFFGMQVWRTFGGFFKSMIQSYKDVDNKGATPLRKALTKLEASFTFLKFSILDAMGPALITFITWIADLVLWVADLDPSILAAIGWGIGLIATVGLAAFAASQVALFATAAERIMYVSTVDPSKLTAVGKAIAALGGLGGAAALGTLVLGLAGVSYWLSQLFQQAGGWQGFVKAFILGGMRLGATIGAIFMGLATTIPTILGMMVNELIQKIETGINMAIWAYNKIRPLLGFLGIRAPEVKSISLDEWKIPVKSLADSFMSGFMTQMLQYYSQESAILEALNLDAVDRELKKERKMEISVVYKYDKYAPGTNPFSSSYNANLAQSQYTG